jgi:choline-phosphate cytidylyltransferase
MADPERPKGRVVTFGTYDLFHIGHVNLLERASQLGDKLIVGLSSDAFNKRKKQRVPIFTLAERMRIVGTNQYVDEVFVEHNMEDKRKYLLEHQADILVMGDDWEGKFDEYRDICRVVYLSRTPEISSTKLMNLLEGGHHEVSPGGCAPPRRC